MLPRQALDQHVEDRACRTVTGVPADAERLAREVLHQPLDIGGADVDFFGGPAAFAPVAGGGALTDLLDLLAVDRAAFEQQLEAVVLGRVVAARDLDSAIDVE